MIHTQPDAANGKRFVLVDQHDVDRLRGGHPIATGDGLILIYFVRDQKFVSDKLQDSLALGPLTAEGLVGIVEEDRKRGIDARQANKRG